jgi:L-threonylcarbamoyladenylate synthase
LPIDELSINRAAATVRSGGLVVYPTDTVYGLGCDPMNAEAVDRLFRVKRRESKPIPVLCDSLKTATGIVDLRGKAALLARRFWPGPLTIVAKAKVEFPLPIHQGSGFVGMRVPSSRGCLALISECGGIITGTSANLSGRPPCRSSDEALAELGTLVDLVLNGGRLYGLESTVVRISKGRIDVLRQGALTLPETI